MSDLTVLKVAFETVDKDKAGKINVDQLKDFIVEIVGPKDAKDCVEGLGGTIPKLFKHLDADNDGMLTYNEVSALSEYGDTTNLPDMMMTAIIHAADADKNGWITATELMDILLALSPTGEKDKVDEMVPMLMAMMASDDATKCKVEEVVGFLVRGSERKSEPKDKYKMMFRMVDTNSDGMLSKKEFKKFMNMDSLDEDPITKGLVNLMLDEADKDGDGKLNYEEFCAFLDKKN